MHRKAIISLIGGMLIHLTLGAVYTTSNIVTYVISYLHVVKHQAHMDSSVAAWIFSLQNLGEACFMVVGGILQRLVGLRCTALIGCSLITLVTFCGQWTVNNYVLFCITYGLMFGLGNGITVAAPMTAAMKWLPKNKGLANGLIFCGYGSGSVIFNYIVTLIVNPNNEPQVLDPTGATQDYYFPAHVVERLPRVFRVLALCFIVIQFIGICCIIEPNEEEMMQIEKETHNNKAITEKPVEEGMDPVSMMKTWKFWQVWLCLLILSYVNIYISSFYKFFGQTFISDDLFLVTVGSVSSICNGIGRPLWGWTYDKFGYKKNMGTMFTLFAFLLGTFGLTRFGGKWMFLFWVCAMYFVVGAGSSNFPSYIDECFGHKYFGTNYGLLSTGLIVSSCTTAVVFAALIKVIGMTGAPMYVLISGLMASVLGVMLFCGGLLCFIPKSWTYKDLKKLKEVETPRLS